MKVYENITEIQKKSTFCRRFSNISKSWAIWVRRMVEICPSCCYLSGVRVPGRFPELRVRHQIPSHYHASMFVRALKLSHCLITFWKTLADSLSAVSKPNFLTRYSLESSWRDLSDVHSFAPLGRQKINKFSSRSLWFSHFCKEQKCPVFVAILAETWIDFIGISQLIQKMLPTAENLKEIAKNFWQELGLS